MRTEKDIASALRVLAEADAQIEAPPELEARVLREYRRRVKRRGRLHAWIALAAAAAIAIAIFALRHPVRPANVAPSGMAQQAPPPATPEIVNAPEPVATHVKARPVKRPRQTQEIVTEFFPLIDAPPPVDRGELLRVTVPAATMREVGLPVAEDRLADRVQADVVVSEEGLATAIRFVKYQQ